VNVVLDLLVALVMAIVAEVVLRPLHKGWQRLPFQVAKLAGLRLPVEPENLRELVYEAEWKPELHHILTDSPGGNIRRFLEAMRYAVGLSFGVTKLCAEFGARPVLLLRLMRATAHRQFPSLGTGVVFSSVVPISLLIAIYAATHGFDRPPSFSDLYAYSALAVIGGLATRLAVIESRQAVLRPRSSGNQRQLVGVPPAPVVGCPDVVLADAAEPEDVEDHPDS
jgi:hypothetical protein